MAGLAMILPFSFISSTDEKHGQKNGMIVVKHCHNPFNKTTRVIKLTT
jgi:hypothetical protein